MSRPTTQLLWMVVGLFAAGGIVFLLWGPIVSSFLHSPGLNSGILAVALIGIVYIFYQVVRLTTDINWIEGFQRGGHTDSFAHPRLLAPLAAMVKDKHHNRLSMSATSLRSVLDGIQARLDEHREISRYLITLLILLGLLGTFWGLLGTIRAVSDIIGSLGVGTDAAAMFAALKDNLREPLAGMSTSFSTSLFGLASSLVLGFLDLQAGHAQNRFYNEMEEWLSTVTKLSSGGGIGAETDASVPAYVQALLEQTADGLERMQRAIVDNERERRNANEQLAELTTQLARLTEFLGRDARERHAATEVQEDLRAALKSIAGQHAGGPALSDELRSEFRLLSRTIAAALDNQRHAGAERR